MSIIPSAPGSNLQSSGNPEAPVGEHQPRIAGAMSGAPQVIRRQRPKAKDRYIIEHLIGQGGMGAVYKARDVELERTVALKLLHPGLRNGDSEQRLKRELVLASRVSHRHVVRVYDFGEIRGTKFISMAFIDGENLESLLAREGRLAVVRAIHIAEELCEALRAAHTVGVVHRDLKPQNILLDTNGSAYISDFGLARSSTEPNGDITKAGEYPGSPAYMSPE
jgi:serine/threonine protein kinase